MLSMFLIFEGHRGCPWTIVEDILDSTFETLFHVVVIWKEALSDSC